MFDLRVMKTLTGFKRYHACVVYSFSKQKLKHTHIHTQFWVIVQGRERQASNILSQLWALFARADKKAYIHIQMHRQTALMAEQTYVISFLCSVVVINMTRASWRSHNTWLTGQEVKRIVTHFLCLTRQFQSRLPIQLLCQVKVMHHTCSYMHQAVMKLVPLLQYKLNCPKFDYPNMSTPLNTPSRSMHTYIN